jgi:hypothetical protein
MKLVPVRLGVPSAFARPAFLGLSVKPITLAIRSDEIRPGELKHLLRQAVPPGYAGTYPRVVKTLDGEYLLYVDGTAQFFPLGRSPLEPFMVDQA